MVPRAEVTAASGYNVPGRGSSESRRTFSLHSISRKFSIPRESRDVSPGGWIGEKVQKLQILTVTRGNGDTRRSFSSYRYEVIIFEPRRGEVEARAALYAAWKGMSKCQMHFHSVLQLTKEISNCEYEKIEYLYMCRCVYYNVAGFLTQ